MRTSLPPDSKLTRTKQRGRARAASSPAGLRAPNSTAFPPGQHLTGTGRCSDLGLTPQISHERWRLDVYGAVEKPVFWDFAQFTARPRQIHFRHPFA